MLQFFFLKCMYAYCELWKINLTLTILSVWIVYIATSGVDHLLLFGAKKCKYQQQSICLSVCLSVCLFVCLSVQRLERVTSQKCFLLFCLHERRRRRLTHSLTACARTHSACLSSRSQYLVDAERGNWGARKRERERERERERDRECVEECMQQWERQKKRREIIAFIAYKEWS